MPLLGGVYVERPDGALRFRWVKAPTRAEVTHLTHTLAHRIGRFLERQGLLECDGAVKIVPRALAALGRQTLA